ncbi:sodium-dependent phosphate transport protein 2B-like [Gracilinanus agilis]|uniref:sodium-dependent phosphate transport protein 2B-like n=1 Tax=Gracilinanus agilis TaxID=191870 RepID=UPI001CFE770C|nr:sodium-dependent phosphate transport protein 2B-like [Gracilinanus agilis]
MQQFVGGGNIGGGGYGDSEEPLSEVSASQPWPVSIFPKVLLILLRTLVQYLLRIPENPKCLLAQLQISNGSGQKTAATAAAPGLRPPQVGTLERLLQPSRTSQVLFPPLDCLAEWGFLKTLRCFQPQEAASTRLKVLYLLLRFPATTDQTVFETLQLTCLLWLPTYKDTEKLLRTFLTERERTKILAHANKPQGHNAVPWPSEDPNWQYNDRKDYSDLRLARETVSTKERILVFFRPILKVMLLLVFLFFYICSLDILGSAFQLIGGKMARKLFIDDSIFFNPISGTMISLLATVLVQSSSITTSIIVSMVSTSVLTVEAAIPMMMGANVGTAVTNTLVALMYAGDRDEFERTFAGATIHDFFNWLSMLVLLPLELITGFFYSLSNTVMNSSEFHSGKKAPVLLKALTGPVTKLIIQLNQKVITEENKKAKNKSLIKIWCKTFENVTLTNVTVPSPENCTSPTLCWTEGYMTWTLMNKTYEYPVEKCIHLFVNTSLSDSVIGMILLPLALLVFGSSLILLIRVLNNELKGPVAAKIQKTINADFPFPFTWLTGYIAIFAGALLTFVIQSSSVFTSIITPLVGIRVISLERAYALTLGSNIGTTTTAIVAALASPRNTLQKSLQIALCHFFFNITGAILWYPIPFMRLPIYFAKKLGKITATYRWFAVVYVTFSFIIGPSLVFCLSVASRSLLISIVLPLFFVPFIIVYMHTFKVLYVLPLWMTSLKPWDDLIACIMSQYRKCGENLSRHCKNSKLNRFMARRPIPTEIDQDQIPRETRDSLFTAKKSDDTVTEIPSTNDTVREIQSTIGQFLINASND